MTTTDSLKELTSLPVGAQQPSTDKPSADETPTDKPPTDKLPSDKPLDKPQEKPPARDLSDFPEQEAKLLRQMSNDAFNYVVTRLRKLRDLEKANTLYEHPEGYVLHPDFRSKFVETSVLDAVANHYKEQLKAIKAGKQWVGIKEVKPDGTFVYTEPLDPSPDAEVELSTAYNATRSAAENARKELEGFKSTFENTYKTDIQKIQDERKKRFQWVANPELLNEKINVPGVGDVTLKQVSEDFKTLFPKHFSHHPLLDVATDLFLSLQILASKYRELEANKGLSQNPSGSSAAQKGSDMVDLSDFNTL
jgi:hypothetical protein